MFQNPIAISEKAIKEIKTIFISKNIPKGYCLRIGIRSGGCGAGGFFIGFDKPGDFDENFTYEGIEVLIDKRHLMYLLGHQVDFLENWEERGFVFNKLDHV